MLSYPDPHNPYVVREPYNEMFDDLHFAIPQSAVSSLNKKPAPPAWSWTLHPKIPEDTPSVQSRVKLNYMKILHIIKVVNVRRLE